MLNMYTYWEDIKGIERPPYIGICLDRFKKFGGTVINAENAKEYAAGLNLKWKELRYPAHKADCLRVAVINKEGGIWVDADTFMLKNPSEEIEYWMGEKDFVYTTWKDGRVLNGYFASRPKSEVTESWLSKINQLLGTDDEIDWTSFGERILTPLVYLKHKKTVAKMPLSVFLPINIDRIPDVFFEDVDYKAFLKEHSVAVGLNHSYFCDNYPNFVKSEVNGDCLIHCLLGEK